MFNRIRHALSRTSERRLSKCRHSRPLTPTRTRVVHLSAFNPPSLPTGRFQAHIEVLAGEETELVRPYVLASEEQRRRHQAAGLPASLLRSRFSAAEAV